MRLSNFAQDALLSAVYALEDIDPEDLSTAEKHILETALKYDRERNKATKCDFCDMPATVIIEKTPLCSKHGLTECGIKK